jgi:hypothetical protein
MGKVHKLIVPCFLSLLILGAIILAGSLREPANIYGQGKSYESDPPPEYEVPVVKFPVDQKSWPQVDFANQTSVNLFVDAHRHQMYLNVPRELKGIKRKVHYPLGWLSVGTAFYHQDTKFIKVLSDRWLDQQGNVNPDAKIPDDKGWCWTLEINDYYVWRIKRLKAETLVLPSGYAELIIVMGDK